MREQFSKYYIITGGPGVGKTTLLRHLNIYGFTTVPEDARRIIKEQLASSGDALPWLDKSKYAIYMYEAAKRSYQNVQSQDVVFFDRSILDAVCYMIMENILLPQNIDVELAACRYNKQVFILPPWKEIYKTDSERKQQWEEAVYTFDKMKQTYHDFGYKTIEVPKETVEKRMAFVLEHIKK
ncbi:AAA family ATPase [Niabella ginsengisoli]|uniref:AAA family ATPase n=1 Tax=Niabella ginsengisoli TaxID=522298 RepID=A0ABS9SPI1_9BACT|nr:AAA family ATPase [Niabella ginsengisoli]MCH5600298.1 AAA family ATPase [Niabella ginsengisoli]